MTYDFSITDLIQAIGVGIGFPAALWGMISLFIRDKDKAARLAALTKMAQNQEEINSNLKQQIKELSNQTQQFEYQTIIFKESNELLKERISIQSQALISEKEYKAELLALEAKKHKTEIRPYFKPNGGGTGIDGIVIQLINLGARAHFQRIEGIQIDGLDISSHVSEVIEKNGQLKFRLVKKNNQTDLNRANYMCKILFTDEEGNQYIQNVGGIGPHFGSTTPEPQ